MTHTTFVPSLGDDIRFRLIDGEAVVVRQNEGEILVLNGVGSRILQLIDGERSIQAIVDQLAEEYEVEPVVLEGDVLDFSESLRKSGIIDEAEP
jgi:coenzyme PQQ biosynthesis protein PqqD